MGTRSMIGLEENGKITAVYCHWDGYVSGNGKTLEEHYDEVQLRRLLSLGSMSSLGERIDPDPDRPHTFDKKQENVCNFYGRDRGEPEEACEFKNDKELFEAHDDCEYFYLMRSGKWSVSEGPGSKWKSLQSALKAEKVAFVSKTSASTQEEVAEPVAQKSKRVKK
jgi:hypothetical protein